MAVAQKKMDTLDFQYITGYQPTIADAVKINKNPVINDSTPPIAPLKYAISPKRINTTFNVEPITPAKMVGEPLTKLYKTLIKGGIGTYTSPYGELFFNNLRSKEYTYGAHIKHLSSTATLKNSGFSGYSDNAVNLYGKKFLNKHTLTGDLDYNRNVVHQYGYNIIENPLLDKDLTKQRFSYIGSQIGLKSHFSDSAKINHDIRLKYYNLMDKFKTSENNVYADAFLSTYLDKELILVNTSVDYYNHKTALDTINNTIIKLSPSVISSGEKWKASLGMAVYTNITNTSSFYFYPNIEINYSFFDNILIPYAGLTGGLQKNSYKSFSDENPFISPAAMLKNSSHTYKAFAGLRGTLTKETSFNVSVAQSRINSMAFFVNDTSGLENLFAVIYDDVNLLNLHGELAFEQSEKLRLFVKGDYNNYSMTNELKAWHKPAVEFTFSAHYNLRDKIIAKGDIFVLGKQFAKTYDTSANVIAQELKGIADINLGLEYRYTKKLSAFINFNNIGAFRYNRWNNYHTQKFNLMAGFSYAF